MCVLLCTISYEYRGQIDLDSFTSESKKDSSYYCVFCLPISLQTEDIHCVEFVLCYYNCIYTYFIYISVHSNFSVKIIFVCVS